MKSYLTKIGLPLAVLLIGLLAVQGMGWTENADPSADRLFSQKVNLSMRQAADRLFDLAGDSTRTIPPVEVASAGEYLLRLESQFSYDSLPAYLDEALAQNGVHEKYHVAVLDCLEGLLMLGYSHETIGTKNVPCSGRDMQAGCYNLTLVFPGRGKKGTVNTWALVAMALVVALAFTLALFYKTLKNRQLQPDEPVAVQEATFEQAPSTSLLRFANTGFDLANQYIQIGDLRQPLTFREAKLLHFFVQHQNQVLERDAILAAVWEDEGIIVGRSLDVFVSRLRKILQKDPAVKIANVHGVGYRLEV